MLLLVFNIIASKFLLEDDVVAVRERSKSLEVITESLAVYSNRKYPWLEWEAGDMSGKMISVPERDLIPENINEQLIVELYSK